MLSDRDKIGVESELIVYIVATHYGTYYCGITNNLLRRWKEHCNGQSKYLSIFKPKEVVYIEFCKSRKLAAKKERYIKSKGVSLFYKKSKFTFNI